MFNSANLRKALLFSCTAMFLLYIIGCGISNRATLPAEQSDPPREKEKPVVEKQSSQPVPIAMDVSSSLENITSIEKQLQVAHEEWQGTPYRYGGDNENGIDCSAFTQKVFHDFFDKDLPRNTRAQIQVGAGIRRKSIKTGDLIFFKTGRQTLHVGISIGDGNFLHASVSSGVMISNIGEPYWALRYLGARRVL